MKPTNTLIVCTTIVIMTIVISIIQCGREDAQRPKSCEEKAEQLLDECEPQGRVEKECIYLSNTALKECYAHGDTDG